MTEPCVAVFHPGLQHSHQLAWALQDAGLLLRFVSGVPVRVEGEARPCWMPERLYRRVKLAQIPSTRRRHPLAWWPLMRFASALPDPALGHDAGHWVMHAFDRWAAAEVRRLRPKMVVAYENSAMYTFMAAKEVGAKCILDAPSLHHMQALSLISIPSRGYIREVNRRKDVEVELADAIVTCSGLARDSYLSAGVAPEKVFSMLLGATLPTGLTRAVREPGKLRFIFAGAMSVRKSIDLLLDAFVCLKEEGANVELTIVGGAESPDWIGRCKRIAGVNYLGQRSQLELYEAFSRADCLVLPSRFDSFGMVVAEAMAVGVPAVVSTMTGAKALIEASPGSGWIIEPTAEGVLAGLRAAWAAEPDWAAKSGCALDAAANFTWQAYRTRIATFLKGYVC